MASMTEHLVHPDPGLALLFAPPFDRTPLDPGYIIWLLTFRSLKTMDALLLLADAGYGDLTLAGHVHSMQMKLRLFGRAFSPAQLLYTRWSGRYDEGGRTLYINDGTGYVVFPMRLGAYPEITLITLRRCE